MYKFFFILIITSFCYGQDSYILTWEPSDFEKYNLKKVETYHYKLNKKGKIKDSVLVSQYIYNRDSKEIFGSDKDVLYTSHGPNIIIPYNFKNTYTYTDFGKIKNVIIRKWEKAEKNEIYDWIENRIEIISEYDQFEQIIKQTTHTIEETYNIYKKDTVLSTYEISRHIKEYSYSQNKLLAVNNSVDSIQTDIIIDKNIINSHKICGRCKTKYKSFENIYNSDGTLQLSRHFNRDGNLLSTKHHLYDSLHRVIKVSDSSFFNSKHLISIYEYSDLGKTVITFDDTNSEVTNVKLFDTHNNLLCDCNYNREANYCIERQFIPGTEKIISKTSTFASGESATYYTYNTKGLVVEIKTVSDNELVDLERYYYYP